MSHSDILNTMQKENTKKISIEGNLFLFFYSFLEVKWNKINIFFLCEINIFQFLLQKE